MNGISAGFFRGVENAIDAKVTLARRRRTNGDRLIGVENMQRRAIRFRVDGDGRISELATRANDAHGDLAAIGHEDFHRAHCSQVAARKPQVAGK